MFETMNAYVSAAALNLKNVPFVLTPAPIFSLSHKSLETNARSVADFFSSES